MCFLELNPIHYSHYRFKIFNQFPLPKDALLDRIGCRAVLCAFASTTNRCGPLLAPSNCHPDRKFSRLARRRKQFQRQTFREPDEINVINRLIVEKNFKLQLTLFS